MQRRREEIDAGSSTPDHAREAGDMRVRGNRATGVAILRFGRGGTDRRAAPRQSIDAQGRALLVNYRASYSCS
jgi:hypothetical protein